MRINPLIEAPLEAADAASAQYPVVISSRVRLARNLKDYPFPSWAQLAQRRDILATCHEAIENTQQMKGGFFYTMDELEEVERQILVERHLISKELAESQSGSAVAISKDQSFSVMINEEDHLRLQVLRPGFNFRKLWKSLNVLDSALEGDIDFAFSEELGYLTACPTNLGTGIRASVMMHLPSLVLANHMEKVVRAISQMRMAVRGLYGEGSEATGSIFQISNQQTLGLAEDDIIKNLTRALHAIISHEQNAREKLLEGDAESLYDKIMRAYGLLQSSFKITSNEAMNLLGLLRLAVDLQALPEEARAEIDRLFIYCQPGHIMTLCQSGNQKASTPEKRDTFRAQYLKKQLEKFPVLQFKK
jgi:protein arginine kinase